LFSFYNREYIKVSYPHITKHENHVTKIPDLKIETVPVEKEIKVLVPYKVPYEVKVSFIFSYNRTNFNSFSSSKRFHTLYNKRFIHPLNTSRSIRHIIFIIRNLITIHIIIHNTRRGNQPLILILNMTTAISTYHKRQVLHLYIHHHISLLIHLKQRMLSHNSKKDIKFPIQNLFVLI
jgi:hypothetical protein